MLKQNIFQDAHLITDSLIAHRRYLHQHAETGFELTNTRNYVRECLIKMGYLPMNCGKCGLVATTNSRINGPVFLLRADMDALPFTEKSNEKFACTNGNMHACGHDMHTSMLLGAAQLLKKYEDTLCGSVKLMFQPAEEILAGSRDMIEAGVLNHPDVDAAMMIHVMADMPFSPGTAIISSPGVSAPSADYFEIKVTGKGCHGSMPHTGVDPINATAHILIALQEIPARELAMSESAVLTFGSVHGGTAANAIPDEVTLQGSLRTYDTEVREKLKNRLEEISTQIAAAFRTTAKITYTSGCPTLFNNDVLSKDVLRYAKTLLGKDKAFSSTELNARDTTKTASKSSGSEDFSYVSHQVPSVMVALAAGDPKDGYSYPLHHPKVRFDENALADGCALYTYTAMEWLAEHSYTTK